MSYHLRRTVLYSRTKCQNAATKLAREVDPWIRIGDALHDSYCPVEYSHGVGHETLIELMIDPPLELLRGVLGAQL
jgi:hypothetical protein